MQHILVLPMSNPRENLFPLLYPIPMILKDYFSQAWLGVDPSTANPGDPFFQDETRKRLGCILPTLQLLCECGLETLGRLQAETSMLPPLEEDDLT